MVRETPDVSLGVDTKMCDFSYLLLSPETTARRKVKKIVRYPCHPPPKHPPIPFLSKLLNYQYFICTDNFANLKSHQNRAQWSSTGHIVAKKYNFK